MSSLFETSVLTFHFACVNADNALVPTAPACYICHLILFRIKYVTHLHCGWMAATTLNSHVHALRSVGGLCEKRKKKTKSFLWASVINSPFCVRITIFTELTLCMFVYLFFILLSLRFFTRMR